MTPEYKADLLRDIAAMLDEPSVTVNQLRGGIRWPDYATMHMAGAPTKGRTITIEIHGGARLTDLSPEAAAQALRESAP